MYIMKTTSDERAVIEDVMTDEMLMIEDAKFLLNELLQSYFEELEQEPIGKLDAETIGKKVRIARNLLFDALLQYSIQIGDDSFGGVAPHMESAARSQKIFETEAAIKKAIGKARNKPKDEREALEEKIRSLCVLPDDEALASLKCLEE